MENKIPTGDDKQPIQNNQDFFLNTARRENKEIVLYMIHGKTLAGNVRSFDKFSVLLDVGSHEILVFKHAIATAAVKKSTRQRARRRPLKQKKEQQQAQRQEPPAREQVQVQIEEPQQQPQPQQFTVKYLGRKTDNL